jgi:hypothetical protein
MFVLRKVMGEDFLIGKQFQQAHVYLFPHLHFRIGYNKAQVVSVNVTTDPSKQMDITDTEFELEVMYLEIAHF